MKRKKKLGLGALRAGSPRLVLKYRFLRSFGRDTPESVSTEALNEMIAALPNGRYSVRVFRIAAARPARAPRRTRRSPEQT